MLIDGISECSIGYIGTRQYIKEYFIGLDNAFDLLGNEVLGIRS